jgi:hypothetical protein
VTLDPDVLLAGPRGRGLLVHLFDDVAIRTLTMRVDVSDGKASVISGWGPDETVWLRDNPAATSAAVEWRRYQNLGWRMQMTPMEEEA